MFNKAEIKKIIYAVSITIVVLISFLVLAYLKFGVAGIWLGILLCAFPLQIYKIGYQQSVKKKEFNSELVRKTTCYYAIYCVLNAMLCTGGLLAYLFSAANLKLFGISEKRYFIIIVSVCLAIAIIPYYAKIKNKWDDKTIGNIIYDFVPRLVMLLFFVVYYGIKYYNRINIDELVPAVFVLYLGMDRFVSMLMDIRSKFKEGYEYLYNDSEKWLKKEKKIA